MVEGIGKLKMNLNTAKASVSRRKMKLQSGGRQLTDSIIRLCVRMSFQQIRFLTKQRVGDSERSDVT